MNTTMWIPLTYSHGLSMDHLLFGHVICGFYCHFSGVSGEGCGVSVEGSVPITEEAVATPNLDRKVLSCWCIS